MRFELMLFLTNSSVFKTDAFDQLGHLPIFKFCESRIWTYDFQIMSLMSWTELLYLANLRISGLEPLIIINQALNLTCLPISSYPLKTIRGAGFEPAKIIINRFTAYRFWPLSYPLLWLFVFLWYNYIIEIPILNLSK